MQAVSINFECVWRWRNRVWNCWTCKLVQQVLCNWHCINSSSHLHHKKWHIPYPIDGTIWHPFGNFNDTPKIVATNPKLIHLCLVAQAHVEILKLGCRCFIIGFACLRSNFNHHWCHWLNKFHANRMLGSQLCALRPDKPLRAPAQEDVDLRWFPTSTIQRKFQTFVWKRQLLKAMNWTKQTNKKKSPPNLLYVEVPLSNALPRSPNRLPHPNPQTRYQVGKLRCRVTSKLKSVGRRGLLISVGCRFVKKGCAFVELSFTYWGPWHSRELE